MELYARQLLDELRAGQAGKRMSREVMEGGAVKTEWFGVSSTNADWYRELYQRGISKKAVDKALEKIIQDNGADKGVNVERLKQIAPSISAEPESIVAMSVSWPGASTKDTERYGVPFSPQTGQSGLAEKA